MSRVITIDGTPDSNLDFIGPIIAPVDPCSDEMRAIRCINGDGGRLIAKRFIEPIGKQRLPAYRPKDERQRVFPDGVDFGPIWRDKIPTRLQ